MSQSEYTALPRQEIEIDSATNAIGSDSSRSSLESLVLPPPPPPSPWRVAANKVQKILVPSFLQRDGSAEDGPGQSGTRQTGSSRISTDWLDGLRGVASFFVFLFHHTMYGHPGLLWGYGAPGENKHLVMQLPFIRLIVHGRAMVAIFFVISGYALSFSPLKFIHKKDHGTLLKRLSSSVFRRGMRLAIPSFTSLFLHYLAHITNISPKRHKGSTLRSDTKHLLHDIDRIVNPFTLVTTNGGFHFNGHLWTIPIEFRGSMILFVTILGLSRCRAWVRMVTVACLCTYFMAKEQWNMALFLAGMVVAESNLLLLSEPAASDSSSSSNSNNSSDTERTWTEDFDLEKAPGKIPWYRKISSKAQKAGRKAGLIFILILGLYVLSFPNKGAESTPGWMWMASLFKDNPGYAVNVWVSIGSTTVVWAISFIKGCQGVLETRLINYMGKISFSLYLVHGLGNQFIGKPLIDFMWNNFTGREPGFWKECSWLFAIALYIPILIWLADIFWRLVDAPSVTFAKMVEGKCFG
ncbi:hypothetical protein CEP51_007959 [Fusarium floridanum]|uniref:Acyltransferase 3 domain-containing protein n=1 Tax=Fusarium floridanum TaxID=1325733 RepID=A0A428RME9_9HYPO|nr:hypothetical protein CEP51_007959 [Fusarium floridanum]